MLLSLFCAFRQSTFFIHNKSSGEVVYDLYHIGIVLAVRFDMDIRLITACRCFYSVTDCIKLATTSSTGGLLSALQRAMLLLAPKGGIASTITCPL
jgi:hypothetical protein